jgi:hypothetical protein
MLLQLRALFHSAFGDGVENPFVHPCLLQEWLHENDKPPFMFDGYTPLMPDPATLKMDMPAPQHLRLSSAQELMRAKDCIEAPVIALASSTCFAKEI